MIGGWVAGSERGSICRHECLVLVRTRREGRYRALPTVKRCNQPQAESNLSKGRLPREYGHCCSDSSDS